TGLPPVRMPVANAHRQGRDAVDESEWLACTDTEKMLAFLKGRASDRKLRLFVCACCRRIWQLLTDGRSRKEVEVAEQYADGSATREELVIARTAAKQAEETEAWAVEQAAQWSETLVVSAPRSNWDAAQSAVQAASDGRDEVSRAASSSASAASRYSDQRP